MRLRTIGGLWIEGLPEAPALGPRPLALLALLAAADRKGLSRDQVIGILWPETGEEQARHTLSQTLYSIRRGTGRDVVAGAAQLRLDPSLPSDIGELRAAIAAGRLDAVAELYTGKFLEGFYLSGVPEFDRWADEERARLEQQAVRAIEQLAQRTEAAGSHAEAVHHWRHLIGLEPLSARYTLGGMRALAAIGDRSGALTLARSYRESVKRELNAEPDRGVRELEASLRAQESRTGPVESIRPAAAAPTPLPAATGPAAVQHASVPAQRAPNRLAWLVPVALLAIVALSLAIRGFARGSKSAAPFLAVGAINVESSPDTTRLGPVLRDMLSTSLGGIQGLQVVANSRLVELMPRPSDTTQAAISEAARRVGATELIEGELTTGPGGLVLSLRRVALSNGVVHKGYIIRAADRFALVDSATAVIARDLRLLAPSVTVTEMRTSSPGAYALYEEGLRAYYGYDAPAAYRLMKAALERDTGFAMAAYYAWQGSRSLSDESIQAAWMARAKRLAARTIERERLLIEGSIAEVDAPLRQALAVAETLTVKYPSDPEGHILLGNVQWRAGNWAAGVAAYQRAVELDSIAGILRGPYCRVCTALGGIAQLYSWWDSAAASERTAKRLIALRSENFTRYNLIEPLLRQGRFQEAAQVQYSLDPDTSDVAHAPLLYRDAIRWGRYEEVDRGLRDNARSSNWDSKAEAWWLLQLSLRDQGRLREADSVRHIWQDANVARGGNPADQPEDGFMIGLERGHPEVSIRTFRRDYERTVRSQTPPGVRNRYMIWYLTLAGTVYAATGDTAVVRRLADSVEVLGQTSQFGRDAKLHYFLRGLLFQRQGRHAEAVDAFQRSLFSLTDGYTRTNLMLARSLLELHRPAEAIAVLRPAIRGGVDGSNTYTSRTELHEAMALAFEQAGQRDSAIVHWRAVESAWRHADPVFRDRYNRARQRAGR